MGIDPSSVDWVELTSHAEDKVEELGVEKELIWGRVRNLHGFCYRDTEDGGYNLFLPDEGIVIAFDCKYDEDHMNIRATVTTVFPGRGGRFRGSRFELVE